MYIMKRNVLILVSLMLISFAKSQTYEPIVDTTKMWVVYRSSPYPPFNGQTIALKISNDSVLIDNLYWHKTLIAEDSAYSQWDLSYWGSYIREENKVIFTTDAGGSYINTLYNFNLETGDTCHVSFSGEYYTIDTNYIGFFSSKNRYTQIVNMGHDTIYEGIGGKQGGLLGPLYYGLTGVVYSFVCYYKNDLLLYKNPNFESCYKNTYTNIDKINGNNIIVLYPNPSNDKIEIEGLQTGQIEIVDLNGRVIENKKISDTKISIDISTLSSGVYTIRIKADDGIIIKKLVKE